MQTVLPVWVLRLMSKYSNRRNLKHARHTAGLANAVTRELVDSKAGALLEGKENKDILSLLGRPVPLDWLALLLTLCRRFFVRFIADQKSRRMPRKMQMRNLMTRSFWPKCGAFTGL